LIISYKQNGKYAVTSCHLNWSLSQEIQVNVQWCYNFSESWKTST